MTEKLFSMNITSKDIIQLRDGLGKIVKSGLKSTDTEMDKITKRFSKSMVKEVNRMELYWFGRLLFSVSKAKRKKTKSKVTYYWNIPEYGMLINNIKRPYWAPTFVEGNTVKGKYKKNIIYLEAWRESMGIPLAELPFVRVRARPWFDIAYYNIYGDLDNMLLGNTDVDEEILKAIGR